jgi:hypothetical protein
MANIHHCRTIKINDKIQINESLNHKCEEQGLPSAYRIGSFNKKQVINMIRITGNDLWVEEKHITDIYTFEQFNKQILKDLERITEVSDSLPDKHINMVPFVCELALNQLHKSMN